MDAQKYLEEALKYVESESIRRWARSSHNFDLWLKIAATAVQKGTDSKTFAAYIVCVAIGA